MNVKLTKDVTTARHGLDLTSGRARQHERPWLMREQTYRLFTTSHSPPIIKIRSRLDPRHDEEMGKTGHVRT